jgi:hypothetical protein
MGPLTRLTLICFGLNLLAGAVLATPLFFLRTGDAGIYWGMALLVIAALSLLTQLVIGIVLVVQQRRRILGQAMLLAVGILLLIGLSVCGSVLINV